MSLPCTRCNLKLALLLPRLLELGAEPVFSETRKHGKVLHQERCDTGVNHQAVLNVEMNNSCNRIRKLMSL